MVRTRVERSVNSERRLGARGTGDIRDPCFHALTHLQVRVPRHDSIDLLLRPSDHHAQQRFEVFLDLGGLVHLSSVNDASLREKHLRRRQHVLEEQNTHQPDPHVRSDLVIPAPPSVQLPADILADDLRETPFVGSVNVLIIRLDGKLNISVEVQAPTGTDMAVRG